MKSARGASRSPPLLRHRPGADSPRPGPTHQAWRRSAQSRLQPDHLFGGRADGPGHLAGQMGVGDLGQVLRPPLSSRAGARYRAGPGTWHTPSAWPPWSSRPIARNGAAELRSPPRAAASYAGEGQREVASRHDPDVDQRQRAPSGSHMVKASKPAACVRAERGSPGGPGHPLGSRTAPTRASAAFASHGRRLTCTPADPHSAWPPSRCRTGRQPTSLSRKPRARRGKGVPGPARSRRSRGCRRRRRRPPPRPGTRADSTRPAAPVSGSYSRQRNRCLLPPRRPDPRLTVSARQYDRDRRWRRWSAPVPATSPTRHGRPPAGTPTARQGQAQAATPSEYVVRFTGETSSASTGPVAPARPDHLHLIVHIVCSRVLPVIPAAPSWATGRRGVEITGSPSGPTTTTPRCRPRRIRAGHDLRSAAGVAELLVRPLIGGPGQPGGRAAPQRSGQRLAGVHGSSERGERPRSQGDAAG